MSLLMEEDRRSWRLRIKKEWGEIEQVLADAERRYHQARRLDAARGDGEGGAVRGSSTPAPGSSRRQGSASSSRIFSHGSMVAHAPSRRHDDDSRRDLPGNKSLHQTSPRYSPLALRSPGINEYVRSSPLLHSGYSPDAFFFSIQPHLSLPSPHTPSPLSLLSLSPLSLLIHLLLPANLLAARIPTPFIATERAQTEEGTENRIMSPPPRIAHAHETTNCRGQHLNEPRPPMVWPTE